MGLAVRAACFVVLGILAVSACNSPGCGPAPEAVHEVEEAVFASDSVVTYRDGTTRIGVFFDQEHRDAVRWDDLPPAWIVAIVAAEDGRFWSHNGMDANAVARAARDNVEAGGVVSGGSTLTQQTAKTLFDRPDRSFGSKIEELDYALHLEKVYSKRDILTFYANLFHVTGNGSGIGVGARYFFDKSPKELSVLEAAYLAGLVKGPANYDPFPGSADQQAAALSRAETRTRYVLERIVAEPIDNLVPKEGEGTPVPKDTVERVRGEAQQLLDKGFTLPFKKGVFRYDSSVLLDEVDRRLNTPYFQQILAEAGVKSPASSGLTIVTTLDEAMQREASYGLWHQAAELGVMFEALDAKAFVVNSTAPKVDPTKVPKRHTFREGLVTAHLTEGGNHLKVDLGGFDCIVDRDAIVRAAVAVYRGTKGDRYAKAPTKDVDDLVAAIPDGAVVWVSIRDTPRSAPARCDLEARPELQGSVVVVEGGMLRAMVGGTTNKDFNRATAPRQMGSTMKPLIYHAAMTLGWQPDDVIDNRRNVFPFSGTFYLPRPDHEPKPWISLAWAGVNSENLASVWLLHHLTDHLPPSQVADLARALGLARASDEVEDAYRKRIQEAGVLPTKGRVPESLFTNARAEVVSALLADGEVEEARLLRSLYYGWGFSAEQAKASSSDKAAFDNTWLHLSSRAASCKTQFAALERALSRGDTPAASPELSMKVDPEGVHVACGTRPEGYLPPMQALVGATSVPGDGSNGGASSGAGTGAARRPVPEPEPEPEGRRGRKGKAGRPLHPSEDDGPRVATGLDLPTEAEVLVDGRITLGTLADLEEAMTRQTLAIEAAGHDLYDPEILYGHQDFRVLLSLRYVKRLAERYGVRTPLAEVLSLPLGASEITTEEAARLYEGLTTGEGWSFVGETPAGPAEPLDATTVLIAEIRDRQGKVLYRATPVPSRVANAAVGQMTADILRNVIRFGTGQAAKTVVSTGGATVPLGGKTGTTNDFKNAAFHGFLPGATPAGYSAADGVTVASYVGYDDNRPMKRDRISVAGAVGALPAWILTVQGVQAIRGAGSTSGLTAVDGFWPLARNDALVVRPVRTYDGTVLPQPDGSGASVLTRVRRETGEGPLAEDPSSRPSRKRTWWKRLF